MSDKHWSIKTALEQIDSIPFECEAGALKNNVAYRWLKGAAEIGPEFWPGQGVFFEVTAETAAGEKLAEWRHYYIVGCHMDSGTDDRFWTYSLSNDPPAPYHYGSVQHRGIRGASLRLDLPAQPSSTP